MTEDSWSQVTGMGKQSLISGRSANPVWLGVGRDIVREKGEVLRWRAQVPRSLFILFAVRSRGGPKPGKRDLGSNASGSRGRYEGRNWSRIEERLGEECNLAEGEGREAGAAAVALQDGGLHGSLAWPKGWHL